MTDETTDNADDAEDMAAMMAEPGGGVEPSRILNQDEIDREYNPRLRVKQIDQYLT